MAYRGFSAPRASLRLWGAWHAFLFCVETDCVSSHEWTPLGDIFISILKTGKCWSFAGRVPWPGRNGNVPVWAAWLCARRPRLGVGCWVCCARPASGQASGLRACGLPASSSGGQLRAAEMPHPSLPLPFWKPPFLVALSGGLPEVEVRLGRARRPPLPLCASQGAQSGRRGAGPCGSSSSPRGAFPTIAGASSHSSGL